MDTGTILGLDTGTFLGVVGAVIGVIGIYFGIDGKRSARNAQATLDELRNDQAAERDAMKAMKATLDQLLAEVIASNPGKTKKIAVQLAGTSQITGTARIVAAPSDDETEAVARAITRLPEDEKLSLALNYYEDMGEVEIAELLKRTPEEIQTLQRVAFRHLEDDLGPNFGSDTIR